MPTWHSDVLALGRVLPGDFGLFSLVLVVLRTRSATGATAFHIAASRGNHRGLQKLLWSLYHKCGGDSRSTYAFDMVTSVINSPGLRRGQGVVDAALANNVELAMYLKRNWGGVELLCAPSRGGYAA